MLKHVINCFNKANTFDTKLPQTIFNLEGMSGIKTRIFYNEICSMGKPVTYLEVGSWKGSSLISSCYGNDVNAYVIENWSMWGGPKDLFLEKTKEFNIHPTIFEEDFSTFDVSKIDKKIDVYLYDGDHSYESQYDGIKRMWPALADDCIIMIDDWNDDNQVRKGTNDALKDLDAHVVEKFEVKYTVDSTHTPMPIAQHEFWNGIGVFIISK